MRTALRGDTFLSGGNVYGLLGALSTGATIGEPVVESPIIPQYG
jgi:hypothetical protein